MTDPEAVADAGPIIHLDEVGLAEALHVFRRIVVPHAVAAEVRMLPRGPGVRLLRLRNLHVTRPSMDERFAAQQLVFRRLTEADREALVMAQARECPLLTDDLDLRDAAKVLGVHPVGTIGLVVLAALTDVVSRPEALRGLDALLVSSSLFVTKPLLDQAKATFLLR